MASQSHPQTAKIPSSLHHDSNFMTTSKTTILWYHTISHSKHSAAHGSPDDKSTG